MNLSRFKPGPGILVAAAFIGPGTITTASIAGASYGFVLCWALLFSVFATYVLQEMSARLGIATGEGLAENLRQSLRHTRWGKLAGFLVVAAVGLGNAAYEAGNITGAALGLNAAVGGSISSWSLGVGAAAFILLWSGRKQILERAMLVLVVTMSVVFLVTMAMTNPDWSALARGMIVPSLPEGSLLTILALVGTTVVPYNLFLHASTAAKRWHGQTDATAALRQARWDTGLSIGLGGLITLAVMSTSAAAFFGTGERFSAQNMAQQLEPLLGPAAVYFFSAGLFAAGLSSAIAAPLAAAYAVSGVMGWPSDQEHIKFRLVWLIVLIVGVTFSAMGTKPVTAILFAQAANGFLLPLCALFLLWVMNKSELLNRLRNTLTNNLLGAAVVTVALGLGGLKLLQAIGPLN